MPTGIELSAGVVTGTSKPLDAKYGPYASTAAALADVPVALRYQGLTIGITAASGVVEYWFRAGVADANFEEKTTASLTSDSISDTYWNIRWLAENNKLISGKYYRITDFRTAWWDYTQNAYVGQPLSANLLPTTNQYGLFMSPNGESDPMHGRNIMGGSWYTIVEFGDTDWVALGLAPWVTTRGSYFAWNGSAPKFKNDADTGTHGKFVPKILGNEMVSDVVEPLIVLALTSGQFAATAHSQLYPGDTITYDFWETKSWGRVGYGFVGLANGRGWIRRRVGTIWAGELKRDASGNILVDSKGRGIDDPVASQGAYNYGKVEAPYDFRHITWPCRKPDLANSGIEVYSGTKSYKRGDVVQRAGIVYVALRNSLNGGFATELSGNGSISFEWIPAFYSGYYLSTDHSNGDGKSLFVPGKLPMQLPNTEEPWAFWGSGSSGTPKYTQAWGYPRMAFNINIYAASGAYVHIPWDYTSVAQKPTFAVNADTTEAYWGTVSQGGVYINGYGNVFYTANDVMLGSDVESGCNHNTFLWSAANLRTGREFTRNVVGYAYNFSCGGSCYDNYLWYLNNVKTSSRAIGNNVNLDNCTIGSDFIANLMGGGAVARNTIGDSFVNNFVGCIFVDNVIGSTNGGNYFGVYNQQNVLGSNNFNLDILQASVTKFNQVSNLTATYVNSGNTLDNVFHVVAAEMYGNQIISSGNIFVSRLDRNKIENSLYLELSGSAGAWAYNEIASQLRIKALAGFTSNKITEPYLFGSWSVDADFTAAALPYSGVHKAYQYSRDGYVVVTWMRHTTSPEAFAYFTEALKNAAGAYDRWISIN